MLPLFCTIDTLIPLRINEILLPGALWYDGMNRIHLG